MANSNEYLDKKQETTSIFTRVKQGANLIKYIEDTANITSKRSGNSVRFNPCPFCEHNDCFSVMGDNEDGYKCFSCSASGDVFTFAEEFKKLKKGEALRDVAQFFGADLPEQSREQKTPDAEIKQKPLHKVLNAAADHYSKVLAGRPESMAYLTTPKPDGRGHTQKTIDTMEIGFTDGKMADALVKQGFSLDVIKQSGLYVEKKKEGKPTGEWRDYFLPGLIIFPHRNEVGDLGHFTIKDPRKKLAYQLKADNRIGGLVWGNQRGINNSTIIIVEGENDYASFLDVNIPNVMPTLGQLSEKQIQWLLTQSNGKHFVLWFDFDLKPGANGQPPAGIKYTRKLYKHLMRQPDCTVSVASAFMEPGEDPDDFLQKDKETANKRVQSIIKKAHHPLLWELKVLPADIKDDLNATLNWLEEIDYFSLLGQVPSLQSDAIVFELQKLGFARDNILENIKTGFDLREQIKEIENQFKVGEGNSKPSEGFMRMVSAAIWDYFKSHGKFFVSGDTLHLFYHHKIYNIGTNTAWESLLHKEADLNSTQALSKYVHAELKALCYNRGDRLNAFSWVHMLNDGDGPTIFLNLKDPGNRILKLSAGEAELMENGTNPHAVLLAESEQMQEFKYDPEVNVPAAMRELKELFFDSLACDYAQRYLIVSWLLSTYLMPLTPSKALMKLEGGSGSGKTTGAKFGSLLLYGKNMVGRSSTAGDYSMGSTEPLIIKDNLETDDINKQSLNFLLLAATGATNIKRKGGTESGVTTEKLNCLVCITSIEPFAKPELINRTYLVQFLKKHQRLDYVESEVEMKLLGKRNDILSAWIQVLANEILPSIENHKVYLKYLREQHKNFSKERTSEFMALLALISKSLLKYIPLPNELAIESGGREPEYVLLDAWVKYQNEHAKESEQGTNAVLQLLEGLRRSYLIDFTRNAKEEDKEVWCTIMQSKVERNTEKDEFDEVSTPTTYSFETNTNDLLAMMQRYAREYGIKIPFKTSRQLGVRITNEMHTLVEAGWSRVPTRKVRGTRFYELTWADEPPEPAPKAQ